jgi:mRNA-degrading endonuclease toxin of MazEF toxin-antitoxin module
MPAGHAEITVAYLTSTIRHRPVEVLLTPADGVPQTCVVNLDTINSVPKKALQDRICLLTVRTMAEVKAAIVEALDLP